MKLICFYSCDQQGHWVGVCTSFDLAAEGDSLEEAEEQIHDAIATYFSCIMEYPRDRQVGFLRRKSPLSVRLWLEARYRYEHAVEMFLGTSRKSRAMRLPFEWDAAS